MSVIRISCLRKGGPVMEKKAKWTFMVYLAGDNDLSTAGEKDIGEMRSVGSSPDVNVIAKRMVDEVARRHSKS